MLGCRLQIYQNFENKLQNYIQWKKSYAVNPFSFFMTFVSHLSFYEKWPVHTPCTPRDVTGSSECMQSLNELNINISTFSQVMTSFSDQSCCKQRFGLPCKHILAPMHAYFGSHARMYTRRKSNMHTMPFVSTINTLCTISYVSS